MIGLSGLALQPASVPFAVETTGHLFIDHRHSVFPVLVGLATGGGLSVAIGECAPVHLTDNSPSAPIPFGRPPLR